MLGSQSYIDCIVQQLEQRGFGEKKQQEILKRFNGLTAGFTAAGHTVDAEALAMSKVFSEIIEKNAEKMRATLDAIEKHAAQKARIDASPDIKNNFLAFDGKTGGVGVAIARGAVSFIEKDARLPGNGIVDLTETYAKQLYAIMSSVLEKIGKGAFGVQRGKAHLPNVIYELFGTDTGDAMAKQVAEAWRKTSDSAVDLFNMAGGSLKKLATWNVPQGQTAARLSGREAEWISKHKAWLDWNNMRYPDGSPIPVDRQDATLKAVYDTLLSNGASKLDDAALRGQGNAVGNMLDHHRFLMYKDAKSWLEMHDAFGEGTIFDVMTKHVDNMASKTALVSVFGRNPAIAARNIQHMVEKKAYEMGGAVARAEAQAVMKNKFDPMFETATRQNPMDPTSHMGNFVIGTSNLLNSALLGSASIGAAFGDFGTSFSVRTFNKIGGGPFSGIGQYFKAISYDGAFQREIAAQCGFVGDQALQSMYAMARFSGSKSYGPAITKRISDGIMRMSLMAKHTETARWVMQSETMGALNRFKGLAFDQVPCREMMQKHGINAADWDAFRNGVQTYAPRGDIAFLRPIDILNMPGDKAANQALFQKFHGMVLQESYHAVPKASLEATTWLKGTTRPDTFNGVMQHSFAMFKNYPIAMMMLYGRMALSTPSAAKRVGFISGLVATTVLVGAMTRQMKALSQGKDLEPMNDPAFLGRSLLSGGGLGIMGDFLFAGANDRAHDPLSITGGPLLGLADDIKQLSVGTGFNFISGLEAGHDKDLKLGGRLVQFMKRYTPGANLWWSRLVMERYIWDGLEKLADPRASQAQDRRRRQQIKAFGNDFYWPPGASEPARAPEYRTAP